MNILDEFEKNKDSYREGMIGGMKKHCGYKGEELTIKTENIILYAIRLAYRDAQRTFKGISNKKEEADEAKQEAFNNLADEIVDYFKKNAATSYDEFSQKLNNWRSLLIDTFGKRGIKMTQGQAQKIVNMAFKNLRCYNDADENLDHFRYCHIPLDGYTLGWFREILSAQKKKTTKHGEIEFDSNTTWSNLNDVKCYNWIQEEFKDYLESNGKHSYDDAILLDGTCLETEFVVWPYLILKESINNLIKSLSKNNLNDRFLNKKILKSGRNKIKIFQNNVTVLCEWLKTLK